MKIAIEGCSHGELNKIYDTIEYIQSTQNIKIDLLICCGDFQSFRDRNDMLSMAAPAKYQAMGDFHEYYTEKRQAPVLTLFVGGNHESANYLWQLPYGGWVAHNIYYLGYAGCVNFAGFRIAGLSGIFKEHDYHKGHFESPPFNDNTKRSFYHVRSIDVAKLKLLKENKIDVFVSHDWPRGIYKHGDSDQLIRFKPFLKKEIEEDVLGSVAGEDLLNVLKPKYWFAAHLHAKFSAVVHHPNGDRTKFLALDKCLPKRNFLQVIDVGPAKSEPLLNYDPYWLAVLQDTGEKFSNSSKSTLMTEFDDDLLPTLEKIENFLSENTNLQVFPFLESVNDENMQTTKFCNEFKIFNPCNIKSTILNNQYGSSQKTFRKLNIPKPKVSTPTQFKEPIKRLEFKEEADEDEFSELTNPSVPNNPDEIHFSESDSDSASDSDEDESSNEDETFYKKCRKSKQFQYNSNMSTVESPYASFSESSIIAHFDQAIRDNKFSAAATPLTKSGSVIAETRTESSKTIIEKSTIESPSVENQATPNKRMKLVRRNQDIYKATPHDEE